MSGPRSRHYNVYGANCPRTLRPPAQGPFRPQDRGPSFQGGAAVRAGDGWLGGIVIGKDGGCTEATWQELGNEANWHSFASSGGVAEESEKGIGVDDSRGYECSQQERKCAQARQVRSGDVWTVSRHFV